MNAIEIKDLSKSYGDFALKNINLTLPSGCIMGLVGENGAGKSTTIKLIMNAVRRDAGSISVLGMDNESAEFCELKNDIGVVLDEAYLPEALNARNINHFMKAAYKRWDEQQFFEYIKRFMLPENKPVRDYSRGMKMKLAIASALSHQPKLLILDEATSGLDPIVRDEILDILNEFTRDESHSILMSSHIISDLEKCCDYIAFIHRGELIFCEEKDRLLEEYGTIRVSKERFAEIPGDAVLGKKVTPYGVEALVDKSRLSEAFVVEHTALEDIILFLAKGENK